MQSDFIAVLFVICVLKTLSSYILRIYQSLKLSIILVFVNKAYNFVNYKVNSQILG